MKRHQVPDLRAFSVQPERFGDVMVTIEEAPGGFRAIGADRRFRGRRLEAFGPTVASARNTLLRMAR